MYFYWGWSDLNLTNNPHLLIKTPINSPSFKLPNRITENIASNSHLPQQRHTSREEDYGSLCSEVFGFELDYQKNIEIS